MAKISFTCFRGKNGNVTNVIFSYDSSGRFSALAREERFFIF